MAKWKINKITGKDKHLKVSMPAGSEITIIAACLLGVTALSYMLLAFGFSLLAVTMPVIFLAGISLRLINKIHSGYSRTHYQIAEQLKELDKSEHTGMVMVDTINEMAGLISAINNHLSFEQSKHLKKNNELRELKICRDTAEVELQHLKSVIFSIAEGVIISDQEGNIVLANRKAQEIFGFLFDNNGPEPIEEVISSQDLISLVSESNYKDNAYIELNRQVNIRDNRGNSKSYKLVCWPVYDAQDCRIGQVIVSYDITTEHEIQMMKDDIIHSISHELKTPLAAIRAYAEMVSQGEYDAENTPENMAAIIESQARRLAGMIDDILHLSRIENGAVMLVPQNFNMNTLLNETIMTVRPMAKENNIEIITQYSDEQLECYGDNELLYHALVNIITNAIKFSNPGGQVIIKSYQDEKAILIEVADFGMGIPARHLGRIFDKFYRVPGTRNIKGTGLGLNLTKRVIEEIHQGFISVSSKEGQGSVFTISIPKTLAMADEAVIAS
ncbi:MAG: PAS domain S-box protein [Sedimentisphaerales bacterium]|nr:PAS domain S-box protein [Sedimentisphaerales bacterium]MBN2843401.1 PAS domain S-box protein [Sedimentisphaerales bacterium]